MKTYLDCYPCFLRQALEAARIGRADEQRQRLVLDRALETLRLIEPWCTPPEIADQIHRLVRQTIGNGDPYRAAKETSTSHALALYPQLKTLVAEASDPLDVAVRLSIKAETSLITHLMWRNANEDRDHVERREP
jgi:uncharacterized protein with ATP-grasp and redox domains